MSNTIVIMPGRSANENLVCRYKLTLATCKATSDCDLMFLDDADVPPHLSHDMRGFCKSIGYDYRQLDYPRPFRLGIFWNYGTDNTKHEFLCYCNADVSFFSGWLDKILQAFAVTGNTYETIQPFSWHPTENNVNYRREIPNTNELVVCDHPSNHCAVFRRSSNYRWEEFYTCSESDCDQWLYMRYHKKKAAIHYGARVDHTIAGVRNNKGDCGDQKDAQGRDLFDLNREFLRAKWGPLLGITKW